VAQIPVPNYASGIHIRGEGYWSFSADMLDADQGFKVIDNVPETVWFSKDVANIYLFGELSYQFLSASPMGRF
jgi:hypothetical protein